MIIEMPLINCKIESKFNCTKYWVLNVAGGDNMDANSENIIFIIKDTFLLSFCQQKIIKKLSKLLGKGFERSVYWNECKTKSENNNTTNEYKYFLESNLIGVNILFILIYLYRNNDVKQFNF